MRVVGLSLRDFRNVASMDLELGAGLTVVHGPNGAGKTNLLEGLFFGLTAASCRTSNEREVVRTGAAAARVSLLTEGEDGSHAVEVGFAPGDAKRVRVDGALGDRAPGPDVRPLVSVFLPERLELVRGAPAVRRSHLDRFVAAAWPARADVRLAYGRVLAQRNALIARIRAGAARPELLDPWDGELARHGAELGRVRRAAVEALAPPFTALAAELGLPERAVLRYGARSRALDDEGLRAELAERRQTDLERGFTTHGPHRDDIVLEHGRRGLRAYGSQGQQRVGLLSLLFAEREVLLSRGTPPIMLLDDVMSELDGDRRRYLADLVRRGGQALVTTTDLDHVPGARAADVVAVAVQDGVATADPATAAA